MKTISMKKLKIGASSYSLGRGFVSVVSARVNVVVINFFYKLSVVVSMNDVRFFQEH